MGVLVERSMQRVRGERDKGFAPGWCRVVGRGGWEQEWVFLMPVTMPVCKGGGLT